MTFKSHSSYGVHIVTNEEWSRWYTPVYMINGWPMRERVENLLETIHEATQDRPVVKPVEIPSETAEDFTPETEIKEYEQIAIF